jgi:hypothetical protein
MDVKVDDAVTQLSKNMSDNKACLRELAEKHKIPRFIAHIYFVEHIMWPGLQTEAPIHHD